MDHQEAKTIVGYSVFETLEECYQYNENACFIADTRERADEFLRNGYSDVSDCRIDPVTFGDIMSDFRVSCGEYAMESQAYARLTTVAELNSVGFTFEPYDGDDMLLVVQVDGVMMRDDE
jgi:hypothetical protein